MNRNPRKNPKRPDPRTVARAAAVTLIAAALAGAPNAQARNVHDTPRVLGYGSGV